MIYGDFKKNYQGKMKKIFEILVGTNNIGKYKEICGLLPKEIRKYSPKDFDILTPEETALGIRVAPTSYSKKPQ